MREVHEIYDLRKNGQVLIVSNDEFVSLLVHVNPGQDLTLRLNKDTFEDLLDAYFEQQCGNSPS